MQVEFINVPHEQLNQLLFGENPLTNDVEMRKRVAELVKEGRPAS